MRVQNSTMEKIKFSKYQGLGNDFIVLDARSEDISDRLIGLTKENVRFICHRNYGIGADGIILIHPTSKDCDIRMKILNSDGTEAEMCGNGIRCLIKYLFDNDYKQINFKNRIRVDTLAGIIEAKYENNGQIEVNMGEPIFNPIYIPTKLVIGEKEIASGTINYLGKNIDIYSVGMGNPHLITYVDTLEEVDINSLGPYLENHHLFPSKVNVHFVHIIDRKTLEVLVWERGCGQTFACGTGACAAMVATNILGLCGHNVVVNLKGGNLIIKWQGIKLPVFMEGEAKYVYSGLINL